MSHPSRVRGLKYEHAAAAAIDGIVAPFTGAWIEILGANPFQRRRQASHPSRVRGLK